MNHKLIPDHILNNVTQGCFAGQFQAIGLFVDLSGFTQLTATLMEHGAEGAEIIAEVLSAVFDPLIEIVYQQGGFVAAFAGDAFKAIFPAQDAHAYIRAIVAAWQISQFIAKNPSQITRFGVFNFGIKVSIADGCVEWGVWQATAQELASPALDNSQRAAYFFIGEALARCLEADCFAVAGAVVMTEAVYEQLPQAAIRVEPLAHYQRLTDIAFDQLSGAAMLNVSTAPVLDDALAALFFSPDLLQRQTTGELRQVATVFVNLQKMPTGPAAVEFQQTLFRLLAQYGGYLSLIGHIGNQDTGCTLVLFWGAPTSYENNLRHALYFLLDLRHAARIPLRASITFNMVYAGFVGSARREEYTCYGTYVNLAARQMLMANWGEMVLDEKTARQAQAEFGVTEHGWHRLKGFPEKRLIFLLDQRRETTIPVFYRSSLVGRHRELAQLWQAVQPILQGKFGGMITLIGPAGIGKSRLVYELQKQIQIHTALYRRNAAPSGAEPLAPVLWLTCRTDEILHQPLNPFERCLRSYFKQLTTLDEAGNKQRFVEKLDELIAGTPDKILADELDRTRYFLAALVGLSCEDSLYQKLTPQMRFDNTLDALKALVKAESLRQPLIIHLEDAHWLDAKSRLFLEKLTGNVEEFPFLLILTTRPSAEMDQLETYAGQTLPDIAQDVPQTMIYVPPLSKDDLYLLAIYQLGGAVTPTLVELLHARVQGNPFFAEQILLYWQEHELLTWSDLGWQIQAHYDLSANGMSPLSVDIRIILTAHLDRLPQSVKEVVQTAAVLGNEFDAQVLDHMLEYNSALPTQMAVAERADIWFALDLSHYLFCQALLRESAYDMQLRARLRKLHRRAAQAIKQVYAGNLVYHYADLAYHYQQSGDTKQEQQCAKLAGEYAAERYANEDAVHYFSRALALTDETDWSERYDLLTKREAVYNLLGQREEQRQDLLMLYTLASAMQAKRVVVEVMLKQVNYELMLGNHEAALTLVQQVVVKTALLADLALEAQAYHLWGRILSQQGHYQRALPKLEHALKIAGIAGRPLDQADSLYDSGHVYHGRGQLLLAFEHYTQAHAIYQNLDNLRGELNCLLMFGVIANEQGDYTLAHHHYSQTIVQCKKIGWRYAEAISLTNLGNNYFDFGDYEAARDCHLRTLEICREIGDQEGEAISLDTLGLIWQNLGNTTLAYNHFEQALKLQRQLGDLRSEGFTMTHLGYLLWELGELEAASDMFQNVYNLRKQRNEESLAMDDLAGLALSALAQGDLERARLAAEEIGAWLEIHGNDGIEFPILVYLACYYVFNAAAQLDPLFMPHATKILDDGYTLLQQRAAKIEDLDLRHKFLENVWFNRDIAACWEQSSALSIRTL
ncbi:MAG: tetratricopeptide repeat protein [Chloroflexi bacterium]|nr:tetratricopeptide repeat protein [Chloroflexota bacterium]